MPRQSFAHHPASRSGGLRSWFVGLGLILAVCTGILTFFVGVLAWLALGVLRALTSPFRGARPRWSVRVERPGQPQRSEPSVQKVNPRVQEVATPESTSPQPTSIGDAQDVHFEEIR